MMRAGALVTAGLIGLVLAAPAGADTTAWSRHGFDVDTGKVVRRSNIVLDRAPVLATQSMPVGNGVMGAAVWAQDGFTAQLGRTDTFPTRRSPGQVVIPGLEAMTSAPDYRATVDLYDAVYRQSGGGMSATTYVQRRRRQARGRRQRRGPGHDADGRGRTSRPGATRRPEPPAGSARLAETWVDDAPDAAAAAAAGRSGRWRRSPPAGATSPQRSSTRAPFR